MTKEIIWYLLYALEKRFPEEYKWIITHKYLNELITSEDTQFLKEQKEYAEIWDNAINNYSVYLTSKDYIWYSQKERNIIKEFTCFRLNSNSFMHFILKNLLLGLKVKWFDDFLLNSSLDKFLIKKNKTKKHKWWTLFEVIIWVLLKWKTDDEVFSFFDYFFKDELNIILNKDYLSNKIELKKWISNIIVPLGISNVINTAIISKTIFFEFDGEFYETCGLFNSIACKLKLHTTDVEKFTQKITEKQKQSLNIFWVQYSNIIKKWTAHTYILRYLCFRILQKTKDDTILKIL